MRALITGARGTVGRALSRTLQAQGFEVVAWDRARVPIDDYHAMKAFIERVAPEVVYHLAIASEPTGREGESWLVNYQWPSELAWITRHASVRFVFTSTAMVFSNNAWGPFTLDSEPDAGAGYGFEKREAEQRIFHQNPYATIARLGWQIGDDYDGNQLRAWLAERGRTGTIEASARWLPACAFLDDTAEALWRLLVRPPGLYQLDSNRGWSFYEIASALADIEGWTVQATDEFVYDQRLIDPRAAMPPLSARLKALAEIEPRPTGFAAG